MATFTARTATSLGELRFSRLNDLEVEFLNNVNETFRGTTYQDIVILTADDESGANFGGRNISFDRNDNPTSGLIEAIQVENPGGSEKLFISGISVGAVAIGNAVSTNSFTDDLAIWAKAFSGADTFRMSNGNDNMRGFSGADKMYGNSGNDTLAGNAGADLLVGGNGRDRLLGQAGEDNLQGGRGDDYLSGGDKADRLGGGAGTDELRGGRGADTFVFVELSTTSDTDHILDFQVRLDTMLFKTGETDVDDLRIRQNADGDAVIQYAEGKVILEGVDRDSLRLDNFDFG